jgi:hypothetical protein
MASFKQCDSIYCIQYYAGTKQQRVSLDTDNNHLAMEKLRQLKSAEPRGDNSPMPTKTPIAQVVGKHVQHIRTRETAKSAESDVHRLRDEFGPICDELRVTSRRVSEKARKRALLPNAPQGLRRRAVVDRGGLLRADRHRPRQQLGHRSAVLAQSLDSRVTG